MSGEFPTTRDEGGAIEPTGRPWVTWLSVVACLAIFVGLHVQDNNGSRDSLGKFGYLPANAVWDGAYWALISSAFVHFEIWHVAFNVYWLWVLGSRLETAIGSLPFLAFVVVSAFVSSSFQLAASGDVGIGASGVGYAIFGFMWPTRRRYPQFYQVLNHRVVQLFLVWLLLCMVATRLDIGHVGNAAHLAGLLFGSAVAGSFVLQNRQRVIRCGLGALVTLSVIPLFWCPWSVNWLRHTAYKAHVAKDYDVALDRYTQIIGRKPDDAWAYLNRSYVYLALGEIEKARADQRKAHDIDPSIEDSE